MTLEQALQKITDPEAKATLQKITSDQNSYITRLEAQVKELSSKANSGTGLDQATKKYLEQSMRKDTIAQAKEIILKDTSIEMFNAVEPDWLKFLEEVSTQNFTLDYIVNAFELTLGKCLRKKDHPVHNIGKGTPTPSSTPNTAPTGSNESAISQLQQQLQNNPPAMNDVSVPGVPKTEVPISNTRDAFNRFKGRFNNGGRI